MKIQITYVDPIYKDLLAAKPDMEKIKTAITTLRDFLKQNSDKKEQCCFGFQQFEVLPGVNSSMAKYYECDQDKGLCQCTTREGFVHKKNDVTQTGCLLEDRTDYAAPRTCATMICTRLW